MSSHYDYDDYHRSRSSYSSDPYGNGYSRSSYSSRDTYTTHPPSSYVREKDRREDYPAPRHVSSRTVADKDDVPHSRLFVVHGAQCEEDDLRKAFKEFGSIEDIRMVKKRGDKESLTGIAFVKYSKASEAALAIEELNGKTLPTSPKPLKVMVATRYGTGKDSVSEEELIRLFIRVPTDYAEEEIKDHFSQFGNIEFINLVKDRATNKPKGFAFVKFFRFYEAATALEKCDPGFKPVFAESRETTMAAKSARQPPPREPDLYGASPYGPPPPRGPAGDPTYGYMGMEYLPNSPAGLLGLLPPEVAHPPSDPDASSTLKVLCAKDLDERNLTFLCEIIPGFKRCDMLSAGSAQVTFNSVNWAQYAHKKLNGLEYPIGSRLVAKFIADGGGRAGDLPFYPCSVELPSKKPMVDKHGERDRPYKARLFLICSPRALTVPILEDVFCRFGSLLDVYTLPGKTVGYAKFDSKTSAEDCRLALNGAEIAGCRIKVIEAEEERPNEGGTDAKRRKT